MVAFMVLLSTLLGPLALSWASPNFLATPATVHSRASAPIASAVLWAEPLLKDALTERAVWTQLHQFRMINDRGLQIWLKSSWDAFSQSNDRPGCAPNARSARPMMLCPPLVFLCALPSAWAGSGLPSTWRRNQNANAPLCHFDERPARVRCTRVRLGVLVTANCIACNRIHGLFSQPTPPLPCPQRIGALLARAAALQA